MMSKCYIEFASPTEAIEQSKDAAEYRKLRDCIRYMDDVMRLNSDLKDLTSTPEKWRVALRIVLNETKVDLGRIGIPEKP